MNITSSQIVWLFFQSGFGGDQLYYLLNNTGYFAYPYNNFSRVDKNGKRYIYDMFEFNFHFPPDHRRPGLLRWKASNWQEFKPIVEHYVSKHQDKLDVTKPIIIKGHCYLTEKEILQMAPDSRIIYMTTALDPTIFLHIQKYKNEGLKDLQSVDVNEIKDYNITVKKLAHMLPNAHAISAEDYFTNNEHMWQRLSEYLGLDVNTCSIEHQYYLEQNQHFFKDHAL